MLSPMAQRGLCTIGAAAAFGVITGFNLNEVKNRMCRKRNQALLEQEVNAIVEERMQQLAARNAAEETRRTTPLKLRSPAGRRRFRKSAIAKSRGASSDEKEGSNDASATPATDAQSSVSVRDVAAFAETAAAAAAKAALSAYTPKRVAVKTEVPEAPATPFETPEKVAMEVDTAPLVAAEAAAAAAAASPRSDCSPQPKRPRWSKTLPSGRSSDAGNDLTDAASSELPTPGAPLQDNRLTLPLAAFDGSQPTLPTPTSPASPGVAPPRLSPEAERLLRKYPDRIPVVCRPRTPLREGAVSHCIKKEKFLVPRDWMWGQWRETVRKHVHSVRRHGSVELSSLPHVAEVELFVNNSVVFDFVTVAEAYEEHKADDGFLYVHSTVDL